jgi:uncharacterized protein YndB with AHSA1/START domain
MKITYSCDVPLSPEEVFAFVADTQTVPLYLKSVESVEPGPDWGEAGGHAEVTSVILGRTTRSEVTISEWDAPRRIRYTMTTPGLPPAEYLREFTAVDGGTHILATTEFHVRHSPAAVVDVLDGFLLKRMLTAGMAELHELLAEVALTEAAADERTLPVHEHVSGAAPA